MFKQAVLFIALLAVACDLGEPSPGESDGATDGSSSGDSLSGTGMSPTATGGTSTSGTSTTGTTSAGSSTTDEPVDETTGGELPLDLGPPPPPVQMCHELPIVAGGPEPVWCDEWMPDGNPAGRGQRVAVGPAGEIYATGDGYVNGVSRTGVVARYTPEGIREWVHAFDHGDTGHHTAVGVAVLPDGDVVVGGNAYHSDFFYHGWLARLSSDGAPQWDIDLPAWGVARRIEADDDGTMIVVGTGPWGNGPEQPARIARFSGDGSVQWTHLLDGMANWSENLAWGAGIDGAGDVYAVGTMSSRSRFLTKLDPDGAVQWEQVIAGDPTQLNHASDVAVTEQGDMFVCGTIDHHAWVGRYTSAGVEVWTDVIGVGGDFDYGSGLTLLPDGGVVVVGQQPAPGASGMIWLRRYSADGIMIWDYTVAGIPQISAHAEDVAVTPEGDIVVIGTIYHDLGDPYLWLARFVP